MLSTGFILRTIYTSFLFSFLLISASYIQATPVGFVESLQDGKNGLNNLNCTDAAVTSPDDKFIYSSSYCDDALNIFTRDPITGKNSLLSSIVGNETTGEGLRSVQWLVMHPNGKYLFAFGKTGLPASSTNEYRSTLYTYERDMTTGLLTYKSELNNGIGGAWNIRISADGHYLYIGRQGGIEVIQVSGNGVLTHVQSVPKTSALRNSSDVQSLVLSPDNKYFYVDSESNSISWLSRDPVSGWLTYVGEILADGATTVSAGHHIKSLGRSNDGKHLYAFIDPSNSNETVLRHFAVATDGSLTFVDEILSTSASAGEKFYCPSEILVSANDRLVYFIDGCADNFQVWLRDTTTGSLKYVGTEVEESTVDNIPRASFSQINNIGFSKDGHFAIAAVNAGVTTLNLTADVVLTNNFQKSVTVKTNYSGAITLTNSGPSDAHDIEITLTGNALVGLKTANVSLPQGSCNQNAVTLICKLPSLPSKAVETIELILQAPDALDPLQINVVKTQAEIDPDTQTDSAQIIVQPVAVAASSSSSAQSSALQSSSTQSSSSSVQSFAAQSSSAPQAAPPPPEKSGGGSMGFEWLLILSLFGVTRKLKNK